MQLCQVKHVEQSSDLFQHHRLQSDWLPLRIYKEVKYGEYSTSTAVTRNPLERANFNR